VPLGILPWLILLAGVAIGYVLAIKIAQYIDRRVAE
jgi:hypothetical protein